MKKVITFAAIIFSVVALGFSTSIHAENEAEVVTVDFFPDLDADSLVGQAAANLRQEGIIGGYPDGTFQPDKLVNRAELAKFLLLARGREVGHMRNNGHFPDVLEGEWYVRYVMEAAELGILSGYPSGNFKPGQPVNTAEFLKMLVKNFYVEEGMGHGFSDVSEDDWFAPYAGAVGEYELFPSRNPELLEPAKQMTRGEVAVAIYKMIVPKENQYMAVDVTPSSSSSSHLSSFEVAEITVKNINELAQLAMVSPGKDSVLILHFDISSNTNGVKVKDLRLSFSDSRFLDEVWLKGGDKVSADRKMAVIVPVNMDIPSNNVSGIGGMLAYLEIHASVKEDLAQGDSVKVKLEGIRWEQGGKIFEKEVQLDGYELMIY